LVGAQGVKPLYMATSADRFITIFSPEGRLWQVEYAFKAVKQSDITAIGAKGKSSVVIAVQKKVSDKLVDPSTVTHMFRISEHIGACLVGLTTDVVFIAIFLRYSAAEFQRKSGFEMPIPILASRLSERHQLESQVSSVRPTAVSAILFGYDPAVRDFALYRIDPNGHSSGYRAVAAGVKEVEAMSALEKTIQDFDTEKSNATFVLQTLRTVVGAGVEAKDVEVAVITLDNQKYRVMGGGDVGDILRGLAETG
jgi:20S proteasome subunit alpha 1